MSIVRRFAGVLVGLIATANAIAAPVAYPSSGTMHIVGIFVRDEPPQAAGGRGFFIAVDMQIPMTSCGGGGTTPYLLVPKKISGGTVDNPLYRDLYNNAALGFALQKPVVVYVDNCVTGWPQAVAIDVNN